MKFILWILLIDLIPFHSLNAQDEKSQRFKILLESNAESDNFSPYGIYTISDTIFSSIDNKKIKSSFRVKDQLTHRIKDLLKDEYFEKYEKKSSAQKSCGYYVESNPLLFHAYALFIKKNNQIIEKLNHLLESDKDLINVRIYTVPKEFIVVNEFFNYENIFQPKTIDDLRLKNNVTSLCVLCRRDENGLENQIDPSNTKIGFSESKYLISICCPVVSDDEYLCDMLFTYLK
ncbi:MAG TPA: hypothetical protein VIU12_28945 [Chryseolinea sp.]